MTLWFLRKEEKKGKNDFISIASHELRSPLSIIKWYTEILLDGDAGPLTEDQRKYLTLIESSNQRAIDLVRSLLNVSRLDLDTFGISPEVVSLSSCIEEAISSIQETASQHSVEIVTKSVTDSTLSLDRHLTVMMLRQLLLNAVLYSSSGGKVTLVAQEEKKHDNEHLLSDSVVITVTDQGMGIPLSEQEHIFEKMFRAKNVKDSEIPGSGFALYVIKELLTRIGGAIWFSSREGEGSTFSIAIPRTGMPKKVGRTTLD